MGQHRCQPGVPWSGVPIAASARTADRVGRRPVGRRPAAADLVFLQRAGGNRAAGALLASCQRVALPLAGHPGVDAVPTGPQQAHINAAVDNAVDTLDQMLTSPSATGFIDRVFGQQQRATVTGTYQAMRGVLLNWRNTPGTVMISGWLGRFQRDAQTDQTSGLLTLPSTVLAETPSELASTLIHESAHGANAAIVDAAYGGTGFRTMPGPSRPFNAPYYDFTVREWLTGQLDRLDQDAVGNANAAVGGAVGVNAPQQPVMGVLYQRAQAVLTHVRIHAENILKLLVEHARRDEAPSELLRLCAGMPLPILTRTGYFSWPKLDAADIAAADQFVADATVLHQASQGITYVSRQATVNQCTIAGQVLTIDWRGDANRTTYPILDDDLAKDPWLSLVLQALLTANPAVTITMAALGQADQQYHLLRHGTHQ